MSIAKLNQPVRSRWLDWQPQKLQRITQGEPTKPTEPGFEGASSGDSKKIGHEPMEVIFPDAVVPSSDSWPESLREMANERAAVSPEPEAARREVWLSWAEWRALDLNRLFLEQGVTGKLGNITAGTVRNGDRSRRAKSGPPSEDLEAC